jgi:hypothetical protein
VPISSNDFLTFIGAIMVETNVSFEVLQSDYDERRLLGHDAV